MNRLGSPERWIEHEVERGVTWSGICRGPSRRDNYLALRSQFSENLVTTQLKILKYCYFTKAWSDDEINVVERSE